MSGAVTVRSAIGTVDIVEELDMATMLLFCCRLSRLTVAVSRSPLLYLVETTSLLLRFHRLHLSNEDKNVWND